jgi:hypothetical protein
VENKWRHLCALIINRPTAFAISSDCTLTITKDGGPIDDTSLEAISKQMVGIIALLNGDLAAACGMTEEELVEHLYDAAYKLDLGCVEKGHVRIVAERISRLIRGEGK